MNPVIEQKIWDYLDGKYAPTEARAIEELIGTDPEYKAAYEEITMIHQSLQQMDWEEPSLAFTRNIMDKIKDEPVPGSIQALVDKRIIRGLLGVFLGVIVAGLLIVLFQVDWSDGGGNTFGLKIPERVLSVSASNWALKAFFFADTVIFLYLFDYFMRRRTKN